MNDKSEVLQYLIRNPMFMYERFNMLEVQVCICVSWVCYVHSIQAR